MEPINKDDKDGHNSENKKAELIAVGRQLCREKKNDNALIIKKSTMPPGVQRVLKVYVIHHWYWPIRICKPSMQHTGNLYTS